MKINQDRLAPLIAIADELGVTPAQLALAWLLHQGTDIFPIPGTRHAARVAENAKSASITLDAARLKHIDQLARPGLAQGRNLL